MMASFFDTIIVGLLRYLAALFAESGAGAQDENLYQAGAQSPSRTSVPTRSGRSTAGPSSIFPSGCENPWLPHRLTM
jgi:hypothetical protein